jgi:hypothetical protein
LLIEVNKNSHLQAKGKWVFMQRFMFFSAHTSNRYGKVSEAKVKKKKIETKKKLPFLCYFIPFFNMWSSKSIDFQWHYASIVLYGAQRKGGAVSAIFAGLLGYATLTSGLSPLKIAAALACSLVCCLHRNV